MAIGKVITGSSGETGRAIVTTESPDGSVYWILTLKNMSLSGTSFSGTLVGAPVQVSDDAGLGANVRQMFRNL